MCRLKQQGLAAFPSPHYFHLLPLLENPQSSDAIFNSEDSQQITGWSAVRAPVYTGCWMARNETDDLKTYVVPDFEAWRSIDNRIHIISDWPSYVQHKLDYYQKCMQHYAPNSKISQKTLRFLKPVVFNWFLVNGLWCFVQLKSSIHLQDKAAAWNWIKLFKLSPCITCDACISCSSSFHILLQENMNSSQRQIYSQVFLYCIEALNGYIAYFAPLLKRTRIVWGSCWKQPQWGLVGFHGCSAFSVATVLYSRIHICGIIIEDKYYQVQSERVLCICAGAKKRGAVKQNPGLGHDHIRGQLMAEEPGTSLYGPPLASGNTQV